MRKIVHASFIGVVMLFLLAGLIRTLFFPDEINSLENRYANQMEDFSIASYLEGSFQRQTGDALNDQVPFAQEMKKIYNYLNAFYEDKIMTCVLGENLEQYVSYSGGWKFGEHIVNKAKDFTELQPLFEKKVENISEKVSEHPDVETYVYYIERDTDIDFETNERNGVYEYLEGALTGIDVPFSGFRTNNYNEYREYFYRTDHHWNCYGSYKAYIDILEMLDSEANPLEPVKEVLLDYEFSGAKASTLGVTSIMTEAFPAYEFVYPEIEITIDGQPAEDYGMQDEYLTTEMDIINYGAFYGGDNGEIIFDTHNEEKDNLLIIGESYDNAILKLLASSFGKTYSIDLRNYETTFGKSFEFSKYIEENDISKVLLIGSIGYFTEDDFMLED